MAGRTVVVTGGGGGIGAALAHRFAAVGDRIAVLDLDEGSARDVAARIESGGGEAIALRCDVTIESDCADAVAAVIRRFGGVDVLIANAGITHLGAFADTDLGIVRRVMDVNFFGAVHCAKAALPSLLQRRGRIVVMSSVAGFAPLATRTGYAASKHALHGFFESLRVEHVADGLGVTLVCPSFVRTAIGEHALGPHGGPAAPGARTGVRNAIDPKRVADAVIDAVDRGRDLVLVPREARLAWWVSRIAPGLYARAMARRVRS